MIPIITHILIVRVIAEYKLMENAVILQQAMTIYL